VKILHTEYPKAYSFVSFVTNSLINLQSVLS